LRIIYTDHARIRMSAEDRSVSEAEVEMTLADPDVRRPGKEGARIADKCIGDRTISVVYSEGGGRIIVITVAVS
jgi:hypothetical protein